MRAVKSVVVYRVGQVVGRFDSYARIFLHKPSICERTQSSWKSLQLQESRIFYTPYLDCSLRTNSSSSPCCGGHVGMSLFEQAATVKTLVSETTSNQNGCGTSWTSP